MPSPIINISLRLHYQYSLSHEDEFTLLQMEKLAKQICSAINESARRESIEYSSSRFATGRVRLWRTGRGTSISVSDVEPSLLFAYEWNFIGGAYWVELDYWLR